MQRGLSVEDNKVVITQHSLDDVSNLQVGIGPVLEHVQADLSTICLLDELGPRPFLGSVLNQLFHDAHVGSGYTLRDGQVHGDVFRHS